MNVNYYAIENMSTDDLSKCIETLKEEYKRRERHRAMEEVDSMLDKIFDLTTKYNLTVYIDRDDEPTQIIDIASLSVE